MFGLFFLGAHALACLFSYFLIFLFLIGEVREQLQLRLSGYLGCYL